MWMAWTLAYMFVGGGAMVYLISHTQRKSFNESIGEINDWDDVLAILVVLFLVPMLWPLWFPLFGSASLIEAGLKRLPAGWARLQHWALRRSAARSARGRNAYTQTAGDSF